jgi:hypothetical protein
VTALFDAAELLDVARSGAELRGDVDQALRLGITRDRVLEEARYLDRVTSGAPIMRRRELPAGACLGYMFRHCATTRANRRALGLDVPELAAPTVDERLLELNARAVSEKLTS